MGGDDWALEGFCAGRDGLGHRRRRLRAGRVRRALRGLPRRRPRARPRDLRAAAPARAARHDAEARPVLQGRAGRARLRRRPGARRRGWSSTRHDRAVLDAAVAALARRRSPDPMRAARSIAAVDSHTEGMPTRVVVGGVAPIPGATMLERKLHFEAELDDLRLLLMREPRGHGAMSGAILQPRDAPRRRLGRALHRGLRLPADVRARDDRRRHRARRDRHGRGAPSRRRSSGSTRRRGWSRRASRCEGGRARSVTLRNVPSFLHATDREVDVPGLGTRPLRHGVRRQLLRDRCRRRRSGWRSTRRARSELIDGGLAIIAAIDAADRPVHPEDPRIAGCKHVVLHAPGRDGADARAATSIHPGWLDRSPCGTGTSARLAQLHGRGELAVGDAFVNESVIGTRFTGRVGRGDDGRRAGPRSCPRSPAARGSPRWASTCSTPTTRSRPASPCDRRRGRRRRDRRRGGRARAGGARRRRDAARPRRRVERHDRAGRGQRAVLRQGRRAGARPRRVPAWRCTASSRSGSAPRRGSGARAR